MFRRLIERFRSPPAPIPRLDLPQTLRDRVEITVSCGDCQTIPKVRGAGQCFDRDGVRVQRMHNGVHVLEHGYCGEWMTEIIGRLQGHHEPQEERVFHELLQHVRRGGTIVELGAWWSYYALWFLKKVPEGRAVLVEPDSEHLKLGRRNFELNGRRGEFVHASVSRTIKPPRSFFCESPNALPLVPEVSLDHLVKSHEIDSVDVALIDVQGAELDVLHGAVESIRAGKLRFAIISTHHHAISGDPLLHEKCLAFVREHGGHVLAEHTVHHSFSGDGLIAVSFDPRDRELPAIAISHNTQAYPAIFRPLEHDLAEALATIEMLKEQLTISKAA